MTSSNGAPQQHNWSQTIAFCPETYAFPKDVDELINLVREAHICKRTIRVIGSGHSFSPVAECEDMLVSLDKLEGLISVDASTLQACFFAGTKLSRVGPLLHAHGLALPNMGDIDQQSIAGALQTGTHGTGIKLGCLSSFVTEMTLLLPHGELLTCNNEVNKEIFSFARVSLGLLGIVVTVKFQCTKSYVLEEKRASLAFKVFPNVRNVNFTEMEFAIPQEQGPACLYEIKHLIEREHLRIFLPLEYRFVAADDIPLSPFFDRPSVTISLHAYRGLDQRPYFEKAQKIFLRHGGRLIGENCIA